MLIATASQSEVIYLESSSFLRTNIVYANIKAVANNQVHFFLPDLQTTNKEIIILHNGMRNINS